MIEIGNAQDIGKRENQEDYFASLQINEGYLCIVADGMGGYEGGEIASIISVKKFVAHFKAHFQKFTIKHNLHQSLEYANQHIKQEKINNPSLASMGTTFLACYITPSDFSCISVGDSPLYLYRDGVLYRQNENHSIAGEQQKEVDAGKISQEAANASPNRHMITSALLGENIPHIDLQVHQNFINENDLFILSSDGIHTLSDTKIQSLLHQNINAQEVADSIISEIDKIDKPNQDNTTLVTAQILPNKSKPMDNLETTRKSRSYTTFILAAIAIIGIIAAIYYKNFLQKPVQPSKPDANITQTDLNIVEANNTSIINDINITEQNETNRSSTDLNITDSNLSLKQINLKPNTDKKR